MTHASQSLPSLDEMEALLINNPDLAQIRSYLGRFNPIKVMGMQHMEIRHSSVLGWLLDPQESHGLGDDFLKSFLTEAIRGHDAGLSPTALEIFQSDLTDAEIRREWRSIDILVLSPRNQWVFVVENKFHSAQHGNQLKRYMQVADSTFVSGGSYKVARGIYLSLWDEDPRDERYAPIRYDVVCLLLAQVLTTRVHPLTSEVASFIGHYLQVVREAVDMDEERLKLEKLARELYRDHKKVLDFIVENGKSTDFVFAAEAVFGEGRKFPDVCRIKDQDFVFNSLDSNTVCFLPKNWFDALGGAPAKWLGCENWWSGFPITAWIHLTTRPDGTRGQIRLYGEVGPITEHEFRAKLIEAIQSVATDENRLNIKFQRGAADEGKKYSRFFKNNGFSVDDVHDHDKIALAIQRALDSFQAEFEAVSGVLPHFAPPG